MTAWHPPATRRAARIVILAATYGDGTAPASAKGFLDRGSRQCGQPPDLPLAVLGFGDRQFPEILRYA